MRYKPIFIYILLLLSLVGIVLGENPAALAAGDTAGKAEELSYTDVTKQEANYIFIKYISQQGIIKGFPDGSFHPADGLTRAQAAVIIVKAAGLAAPPPGNSSFKDVVSNHWALNYIEAAAKAGYLKGFPDGSYQPEASLTRAQGISLIMRLCTQKERAPLPQLKDLGSQHWAAPAMGTAISLEMIGVSSDGKNIYPEANMTRSGMARALAILLTEDPGLSQAPLEGKVSEISGQVTLTRNGQSQLIISDCLVIQGDKIETGSNGSVRISYPDGSSNLMEANSTIIIKESQGRRYIKKDGTAGVAVDYLNLSMEQGTLYGALATKHREGEQSEKSTDEKIENSTLSRAAIQRLAASTGFHYLAAAANDSPAAPWYKTAETKKVKVKVDMPWGVAAIRGTFVKITVNPDKTCRVSCLTGSADLTGQTGTGITLSGNDTANVRQEQTSANKESALNSEDKATFSETKVQVFFMDASVDQEVNQSADVTPEVVSEQVTRGQESTVKAVIEALKDSGITLTREAVKELQTKVAEVLGKVNETVAQDLQQQVKAVENSKPAPEVNANKQSNTSSSSSSDTSAILPAATPARITLAPGSSKPVWSVSSVSIPASGATDSNGTVEGWFSAIADTIKFTVVDNGTATSSITIDGNTYISGDDYTITAASPITIVVTTREEGKTTCVRTFAIGVNEALPAAAPANITLAPGGSNPVGAVINVTIPLAGATDETGTVYGWVYSSANSIKFTVADTLPAISVIKINNIDYTNGNDYIVSSNANLVMVLTTSEAGKKPVVRTFVVKVTDALPATAPAAFHLTKGDTNPVGGFTDVAPPVGALDTTGLIHGWVSPSADKIKFTVTDSGAAKSTITINGAAYTSGDDYTIAAASPLTIVVTTSEACCAAVVRTFVVNVLPISSAKNIAASQYGTLVSGNVAAISAIPIGTKVSAFKTGLLVPDYATAEILSASGGSAVANQDTTNITTAMVIRVTAEDNSTAEYELYDYTVANLDDLYSTVTSGVAARYILTTDLDFNNSSSYAPGSTNKTNWTSGYGWKPPAGSTFKGTFQGNRHSISHLYIAYDQNEVGLFPRVDNAGIIKNLAVLDASVSNVVYDPQRYGVIAGFLGAGSITDCYCSGSINAIGAVGGIVGHTNAGANILRCKSEVNVTGFWAVGGIVGRTDTGGTIKDCCSTGDITCFREYAGGLVGWNQHGSVFTSWAAGIISGPKGIGGLIGYNQATVNSCIALNSQIMINSGTEVSIGYISGDGTCTACYYRSEMTMTPATGTSGYNGAGSVTPSETKQANTYSTKGWNIAGIGGTSTSTWAIDEGKGFPQLRWHYQPSSSKKILATAYGTLVDGKPVGIPAGTKVSALKVGLVESAYASAEVLTAPGGSPVAAPDTTNVTCSMAVRVTAEDGSKAEYEIYDAAIMYLEDLYNIPDNSNLRYIVARDLDFDGDASYASLATNKAAWTTGSGWTRNLNFTGLLAGNGHSISNLYINSTGGKGLFGVINAPSIVKDLRLLDVDIQGGAGEKFGALCGQLLGGSISNCYCSGRVNNPGAGAVGGLVGHSNSATISGCRSDANVTGGWAAGGLVGRNYGATLSDCSCYGNVTGLQNAGGLVGWNQYGSVTRSFAAGIISGPEGIGGIVGCNQASLSGCFALNSQIMISSGALVSIGYVSGGGSGTACYYRSDMTMTPATGTSGYNGAGSVTPAETKQANTYSTKGWNIAGIGGTSTSTWAIDEGNNYPDLRWHSRLSNAKVIWATNIGTLVNGNITGVSAGTKVLDLKRSISVSKYASLEILASSGGSAVPDQSTTNVTNSMVIRVTAQDGSMAEYSINN